jgi:hypothetical protein
MTRDIVDLAFTPDSEITGSADKEQWCREWLLSLFDGNQKSVETWLERNKELSIDERVRKVCIECNI